MSRFLSLFGFKSEDKIKRVKINTESSSLSDDMNIITSIKSLMNDFESVWTCGVFRRGDYIWETTFDSSSINLTKRIDNVGIKISFYYRFGDEFEISNLFLTYIYPRGYIDGSNSYFSEYKQTTLTNKELLTNEMLDFFYGIYYRECIRVNEISEKEKKLKNKVLEEVIGKANVRDSKLDDLLNNK